MTPKEKSETIGRHISSVEGKRKLAMAMGKVIRDRLRQSSRLMVPCCPKCAMPEDEYVDGEHSEEECTVYRVMES